jgi:hypothetical protein
MAAVIVVRPVYNGRVLYVPIIPVSWLVVVVNIIVGHILALAKHPSVCRRIVSAIVIPAIVWL